MTSLQDRLQNTGFRIQLGEKLLSYDFSNLLQSSKTAPGLSSDQLVSRISQLREAEAAVSALRRTGNARGHSEPVLFPRLCRLDDPSTPNNEASISRLENWAADRRGHLDMVVCLGIGGSYLGNRLLHEALRGRLWNQLSRDARQGWPQLHFAGHHLDARATKDLIDLIRSQAQQRSQADPLAIELLVISKSGTTLEPLAQLSRITQALTSTEHLLLSSTVATGPQSALRDLARQEGHTLLTAADGVGGRFSILSETGLATAALAGIDLRALLAGAAELDQAIIEAGEDPSRNAALLRSGLHHGCYQIHGQSQAVLMPFSNRLESLSPWYVQLLAESLGKASDRQGNKVNTGRTPIPAVGTTDLHAQTQLHQEGPYDKIITTIDVADWEIADEPLSRAALPEPLASILEGKRLGQLNRAALEANAKALASDGRPSDSICMARLDERCLGALVQLLMLTVIYEAELLDVNAFDQPGVDLYKRLMLQELGD